MERGFYIERCRKEGLTIKVPGAVHRGAVHDAIYDDLCQCNFSERATRAVKEAIDDLLNQNVEAVILGCTELPLIVEQISPPPHVVLIDSIDAHIAAALRPRGAQRALEV